MIKIGCCGMAASEIDRALKKNFPAQIESFVLQDIVAAKAVKNGKLDYMIGSCLSGAGGALGMAIAVLGYENCVRVTTAGSMPTEKEIENSVTAGKKAFGINAEHADYAVPIIARTLLKM